MPSSDGRPVALALQDGGSRIACAGNVLDRLLGPTAAFLEEMRVLGYAAADQWHMANLASIGVRSTVDLFKFASPVIEPPTGGKGG
jgi:hypothetical protein